MYVLTYLIVAFDTRIYAIFPKFNFPMCGIAKSNDHLHGYLSSYTLNMSSAKRPHFLAIVLWIRTGITIKIFLCLLFVDIQAFFMIGLGGLHKLA